MPIRFDWTVSISHIVWLLTVLAIGGGILIALQSSNRIAIADLQHQQGINGDRIETLSRKLDDVSQADRAFQAEQRQTLLELSKSLTAIQVEQAKKGQRR